MPLAELPEHLPQHVRVTRLRDSKTREDVPKTAMHDLLILHVLQLHSHSQRSNRRLTLPPPPSNLLNEGSDVVSVRSVYSSSSRAFEL